MELKVMLLHPHAKLPTRGTKDAAGLDLYALEDCIVEGCGWGVGQATVSTGIAVEIPRGYYGKVEARSGTSFKHGIETGAGVVDADYRGEVRVRLYNNTDTSYVIKRGQRIAQIIIQRYEHVDVVEAAYLSDTDRGESGYGSTGS